MSTKSGKSNNNVKNKQQETPQLIISTEEGVEIKNGVGVQWSTGLRHLKVPYSTFTSIDRPLALDVAVLGDSGVGRTALILKYCREKSINTTDELPAKAEQGEIYTKSQVIVGHSSSSTNSGLNDMAGYSVCTLRILDVHSDQNKKLDKTDLNSEELTEVVEAIQRIHGYIILYSRTDRSSFKSIPKFVDFIRKIKSNEDQSTPIIIVASKTDSLKSKSRSTKIKKSDSDSDSDSESDSENKPVSRKEGENLAKKLECYFIESSSNTGANVVQVFEGITKLLVTRHLNQSFRKSLSFEIERSSTRSGSTEWKRGKRRTVKRTDKRCYIS